MPIVLRTEAFGPGGRDVNEHIKGGPRCSGVLGGPVGGIMRIRVGGLHADRIADGGFSDRADAMWTNTYRVVRDAVIGNILSSIFIQLNCFTSKYEIRTIRHY